MDKLIMDEAQLIFWALTMTAGVITALLAISNFKKSIKERKLDLLWKQANSAKDFIHEMHENKQSAAAVSMLDWFFKDQFENTETKQITEISYNEVLIALPKVNSNSYSSKERYILECFDWFFYYIDRVEQHIEDGLFLFNNVKYIFYPYYKKIAEDSEVFNMFMRQRNYVLAIKFWERIKEDNDLIF